MPCQFEARPSGRASLPTLFSRVLCKIDPAKPGLKAEIGFELWPPRNQPQRSVEFALI